MRPLLLIAVTGLLLGGPVAQAQMIAKVETVDGVLAIQKRAGRSTLASAGTELAAGDIVATMKNSTALLVFTDQSQIAMRPESRLVVAQYAYKQGEPDADSMVVNLLKGGVRTLTGIIGKRGNPDAYKMAAVGSTVGVRGVDFIARVCDNDCGPEPRGKEAARATPASASRSVGKISTMTGTVTATLAGKTRALESQKPVFEGDVVESADASSALIAFIDNTQFLLKKNTRATITAFNYDRNRIEQNKVSLEMSSGAVQFSSGATAKLRPASVQIVSPQATIGIRGTAFVMACTQTNAHTSQAGAEAATTTCNGAFYLHMSEGKVSVRTGTDDREFSKGQTAYIARPGDAPVSLASTPSFMAPSPLPKADAAPAESSPQLGGLPSESSGESNAQPGAAGGSQAPSRSGPQTSGGAQSAPVPMQQQGTTAGDPTPGAPEGRGLFIAANDGQVVLTTAGQQEVVITRGETGFMSGMTAPAMRLPSSPSFLDRDPFLATAKFLDASCFE